MDRFLVICRPEGAGFDQLRIETAKTEEEAKTKFDHFSANRAETTTVFCVDLLSGARIWEAKQRVFRVETKSSLSVGGFYATFPVTVVRTLQEDGTYKEDIPFEQIVKGFWDAYFKEGYDQLAGVTMIIQDGRGNLIFGEGFLKDGGHVEYSHLIGEMHQALDSDKQVAATITFRDRTFDLVLTEDVLTPQRFARFFSGKTGYQFVKKQESPKGEETGNEAKKDKKTVKIPLFTRVAFGGKTRMFESSKMFQELVQLGG